MEIKFRLGKIQLKFAANKYIRVGNVLPSTSSEILNRDYDKVFVIGSGKTGTTTLKKTLTLFGLSMGNQAVAEILAEDYYSCRYDRIIRYCYTADAFQDAPFSHADLYKILDENFPGSKFILTVRDNADEWFSSLVNHHTQVFSSDKSGPPTEVDLRDATYRYKGYLLEMKKLAANFPEVPLYHKEIYCNRYLIRNANIRKHFKGRDRDFIEINVSRKKDFKNLCNFLRIETTLTDFPWENKRR